MGCGPSTPAGPAATVAGQSFQKQERVPEQSDTEFVFSMILSHVQICLRSTWHRCGCDKTQIDPVIERARRQIWDGEQWMRRQSTFLGTPQSPGVPVHEQALRSPGLASHSDNYSQRSKERMVRKLTYT